MTGRQGSTCPRCGAPRGADRTPSCDCTERAAEALRETRTAEAAAAEDFDPLRIRPYVDVSAVPPPAAAPSPAAPPAFPPPAEAAVFAPPSPGPPPDAPGTGRPRRRSRRTALLAAGGLAAALAVAAGLALFSYQAPDRDRAAREVRESIPDAPTRAPSSPPRPAPPPAAPPRAPLPSAPATPDPAPSAPSSSPSASPTPSPTASPAPSSAPASGTPGPTPAVAPVLRPGDTGPEVTELQRRLRELNLYGDRIDGTYTRPVQDAVRNYQLARGIKGDTLGEYGPATRKSLESETSEP